MSERDALGPPRSTLDDGTLLVVLKGGSYDSQVWRVPSLSQPLRLGVQLGTSRWTEIYLYTPGQTVVHADLGLLPVMAFVVSGADDQ